MEATPRPSWQVDLKWVAGILACLAVAACGVLFSLVEITERGRAEPLSTVFVAFMVDSRVTEAEFAAVQAQAAAEPAKPVALSPIDIEVRGSEIAGLTKEETTLVFAAEFARVLYDEGGTAAEALILDPSPDAEGQPQEPIDLGPAGALTAGNHSTFTWLFLGALALVVALLGLVAFMSRGFGRAGAPAVVLALSTAPLAALWALAGNAVSDAGEGEGLFGTIGRGLLTDLAGDLRGFFLSVLLIAAAGAALTVAGALLMPLARKIDRRLAQAAVAVHEPETPAPLV
jgi:hypothetical protein